MLDWIIPQTVETVGNKTVVKDKGKYIVYVDKTQQSGPWVKKIWSKADLSGENVLILGLGCGSIVELLSPKAKVTGVEIDSEMISLGKKYFGLSGNIEIVINDASEFIAKNKKTFDLVIVDLYQGKDFPLKFESKEFIKKLSQTVSKDGLVIFNRLTTKTSNFELDKFLDKLAEYLKIQTVLKVDFNTLIVARKLD